MSNHNGTRGAVALWSWVVVAVATVLFAAWAYTVFVEPIPFLN